MKQDIVNLINAVHLLEETASTLRGLLEEHAEVCNDNYIASDDDESEEFWATWEQYLQDSADRVAEIENELFEIVNGDKDVFEFAEVNDPAWWERD